MMAMSHSSSSHINNCNERHISTLEMPVEAHGASVESTMTRRRNSIRRTSLLRPNYAVLMGVPAGDFVRWVSRRPRGKAVKAGRNPIGRFLD
jgi:hypothetical protein